jgi:von Willebrand factor type A domain/HEAT repeats
MGQSKFWCGQCLTALRAIPLLLLFGSGALGQERDATDDFKSVRPGLVQQLRDRNAATRIAAVRKLENYPTVEAAKLLLPVLASSDEEFRRASFAALARLNGNRDICNYLKQAVAKQWKQAKPQPEGLAAMAVLLASELSDVQQETSSLLSEVADHSPPGRVALINLVDELGSHGSDCACRALVQLATLPRFEHDFGYRRAVEQGLVRVRTKSSVAALIGMLSGVKGEVRADIVRHLVELSGQELGGEAAAWDEWWRNNEATFKLPPLTTEPLLANFAPLPLPPRPAPAAPSYYGLPLLGAKIVFVLDTSGSMRGLRIVAAKRELARAIEELPGDVEFNVIAFNDKPHAWQSKLVPAAPEFKQNALYFIAAQNLASGTASYDALEAALRFDAEAIYFLTDGAPFGGKITSPPEIVRAITSQNRYRRLTIHSLGIGVGATGGAFEAFLATLAQQNYGRFERVDQ